MADILCSDSEETSLGIPLLSDIIDSESAVDPIIACSLKDSSNKAAAGLAPTAKVPHITVSSADSPSPFSSSIPKDASTCRSKKRVSKKPRRKDQDRRRTAHREGRQGEEGGVESVQVSLEQRLQGRGWTDCSLATANTALEDHDAMERADISPYTSDEWEEEDVEGNLSSDTDGDHTDSSDDDDPKSQVDRLIEKGTLMYMEEENSALSSEGESDDTEEDFDSESDITDVSPLVSATASPLGMSPVLPRRTIATSPLALHDNRYLCFDLNGHKNPFSWSHDSVFAIEEERTSDTITHYDNHSQDSTNMDLLLQAVIELENRNRNSKSTQKKSSGLPQHVDDSVFIHPIRDNPHHSHLGKIYPRRKNLSFSNEEVRKIDRENKILLKKIMAVHSRSQSQNGGQHRKPSNSSVNRKKEEDKIRRDNLIILKKIQEVKPSRDIAVVDNRVPSSGPPLVPPQIGITSARSVRSPSGSCGATARSVAQSPHVPVTTPRKETAL